MEKNLYIPLNNRALIALSGDDAPSFLQGLITNDINKLSANNCVYALMLTPQGKVLYDFFIYKIEGKIFLDCSASKIEEIKKKLAMYKLRSKVVIEDVSAEYAVVAIGGNQESKLENAIIYTDPRLPSLPARAVIKKSDYSIFAESGLNEGVFADYESLRIGLGIPADGDMGCDKSFPLEFEMDQHNAIDYQKGCYVGQEVTARTHYRGTLRKKPYVVAAAENVDLGEYSGQEISSGASKIGVLCSAVGNAAIALIRVEDLEKAGDNVQVGDISLVVAPRIGI